MPFVEIMKRMTPLLLQQNSARIETLFKDLRLIKRPA